MKRTKNYLITLMCLLGLPLILLAQHTHSECNHELPLPCKADQVMREYYKAHPRALKNNIQFSKSKRVNERPDSYIIPVVFHIFGTEFNGKRITDALVIDALRKTNEDYQGITANYGDDNPIFDAIKAPLNVEFKLAEKDPNGAATTGIIYHRLEKGFGNYWAPNMALYAWNNTRYMNVYIMNDLYGDGVTNNSGVSWYPDIGMTKDNLARVVYNGAYLGTNTDENFRRVLTHEFGHFLNLAHTFDFDSSRFPDGCNPAPNGAENPGDYVDDTPAADRALMGANDLNCHGEKTNWTNFMNYSYDRTSMYTQGQVERMLDALDHPSRIDLWQKSNLEQAFFSDEMTKRISLVSRDDLVEANENDGAFSGRFEFKLINGELANKEPVYGVDFTMRNLPEGLTPRVTRKSASTLELRFEGKAKQHNEINSISNLTISFKNSVLSSGDLYQCDLPLRLYFRDSYNINYVGGVNVTISPAYEWEFFNIDSKYDNSDFGLMCDQYAGASKGNLYIESYGKQMVGSGKNIGVVEYGETIGESSKWTTNISDYPNLGVLVSKQYTAWKGKFAFVGIRFQGTETNDILYGWMKVSVADDGKSFTLVDYAFNNEPGASIKAGQKSTDFTGSELVYNKSTLIEEPIANDGSVTDKVTAIIMGDNTFTKEGVLTLGTDYTLTSIPEGLTPTFEILSDKKAELSFTGKAKQNGSTDSKNCKLTMKSTLFTKSEITNPSHSLILRFLDNYEIKTGTFVGVEVNSSLNWKFFGIPNVGAEYGAWLYSQGNLKLETYNKPMVGKQGTRNITPLEEYDEIGANYSWVYPAATPGQLDIVTSQYRDWIGKTAFAGFSFESAGNTLYGWFKITVDAKGTSYEVKEWAYNEQPEESIMSGRIESNVSTSQVSNILIYPNPATDCIYVDGLKGATVKIYSTDGSIVWSDLLSTDQEVISVSKWSRGIYILHTSKDSINHFKKIVVK